MKKILPILIVSLLFLSTFIWFLRPFEATTEQAKGSQTVNIGAQVGDYYFTIDGFISPYASVVLYFNGVFIRSTVADSKGYFYFTSVLVSRGLTSFCLQAVDVRAIGESNACITFPPASGSMEFHDIFLPPTLGLYRAEINAGSDALAFGYTMPYATVTIRLNDGRVFKVTADGKGYYELTIKNLKAGKYELRATAVYEGQNSLSPSKPVILRALSLPEQVGRLAENLFDKGKQAITSTGFGLLWLLIPLIILIIILLLKLWPERFTFIYDNKLTHLLSHLPYRQKKLHHAWFVGY